MFRSSHFWFLVFGNFCENTKILRNVCLRFARQDGKKWKENHATKVSKIPETKSRKYGMNETIVILQNFDGKIKSRQNAIV